ncbi:MAG: TIGR02301 family protein [Nitratireductor sp.]
MRLLNMPKNFVVLFALCLFLSTMHGSLFAINNEALAQTQTQNQNQAQSEAKKKPATDDKEQQTQAPPAPPKLEPLSPSYEPQLLRLAEVLGSIHYLRALCGAKEEQTWRDEMQKLLEVENPNVARRGQLIAHFNRGFRSFREVYSKCTPVASQAAAQYLRLGIKLSSEIPTRFGS